jgi:glycosyltransferase involved in cell wall biosynthesis
MEDDSLSVLHFSTADNEGGSGRAAYRIHSGVRALGHRSRMLVGQKATRDPDVDTVHGGGLWKFGDRLASELTQRVGLQYQLVPSARRVLGHPWLKDADVIQLYNLHGAYFSPHLLPRLARRAPIVWRLSDMWAVTGHCAYAGRCERWQTGCGHCPDLASYPPIGIDTSAWLWRQKRRLYARSDITVVAPSSWTESVARASPLFAGCEVHRIANGIDTELFRPRERLMVRTLLDLDPDARIVLFVAHVLDDNPRKGGSFLIEALNRLLDTTGIELLLVGVGGESWEDRLRLPVRRMGYVTDDRLLAAIYASADIVVAPSVLENLPNTVIEAMACGVPAVAFDSGGIADVVRHQETGCLIPFGDVNALAHGIGALLADGNLRVRLGQSARDLVERGFSKSRQARAFVELYRNLAEARAQRAACSS